MNLFNDIYNLTYLPILTPYNLLDNLKLENYNSILYKKDGNNIITEITCTIDNNNIIFYYIFDIENNLHEAYYYENDNKVILFDRVQLLKTLKQDYLNTVAL